MATPDEGILGLVGDGQEQSIPSVSNIEYEPDNTVEADQGNPDAPVDLDEVEDFFTDDEGSPYDFYKMERVWIRHEGIIQAPTGSDDSSAPSVFCRTHARYMQMQLNSTAQRQGAVPLAPKSAPTDSNLVLLRCTYGDPVPVPLQRGQGFIWQLSGSYLYGLKVPLDPETDGLPGLSTPLTTEAASQNAIPAGAFIDGLLG